MTYSTGFSVMNEWTIKTPNPICCLFFKIDLLTDVAALCLTDLTGDTFSQGWYFRTSLWIVAPMDEGTICICVLLPLYLLSDLPPLPKLNVQYIQTVCGWGPPPQPPVLNCAVDQILQEFDTLFLTRFRTYKIASPPQTKWPVKTTQRDWCL